MTGLELGIALQGNKQPDEYARLARLTEGLGFDVLSVYADLFFQPSLYPLLIMAAHTHSVRLGPAAFNPFTLHPVEIAGQAAALDAASGGRAFLGLARGSWLDKLDLQPTRPLAALKDTLEIVQRLWKKDPNGYTGDVFRLMPGSQLQYELLHADIPIMIGTWSRGAARLAARYANEVKIGGSANPVLVRKTHTWLAEAAPKWGRAASDIGVSVGAVTVVDVDGERARRLARREVAMYLDVVLQLDSTVEVPESVVNVAAEDVRVGDLDAAGRALPDELLDLFAFSGTPEQICRQVEDLARAGVKRIDFGTPHGIDESAGIRLLGERVLPNFQ